jgi:hypothetical protein
MYKVELRKWLKPHSHTRFVNTRHVFQIRGAAALLAFSGIRDTIEHVIIFFGKQLNVSFANQTLKFFLFTVYWDVFPFFFFAIKSYLSWSWGAVECRGLYRVQFSTAEISGIGSFASVRCFGCVQRTPSPMPIAQCRKRQPLQSSINILAPCLRAPVEVRNGQSRWALPARAPC